MFCYLYSFEMFSSLIITKSPKYLRGMKPKMDLVIII
ncbi:hypothetical protein F383_15176 [Gossypium arboreum]|uniref:Uncharacterized protein n=1 Tax=Gossypium arboreum TaxID=29729 RepID=A0A0B0N7E4_GOSAR|nr:hypothetical protein F383_15176 [Gossypium arboreum]